MPKQKKKERKKVSPAIENTFLALGSSTLRLSYKTYWLKIEMK